MIVEGHSTEVEIITQAEDAAGVARRCCRFTCRIYHLHPGILHHRARVCRCMAAQIRSRRLRLGGPVGTHMRAIRGAYATCAHARVRMRV